MVSNNDKDRLSDAIGATAQQYADRMGTLGLHLETSRLCEDPYGTWLLPAWCEASRAVRKSYELHRLMQDIEHEITRKTDTVVTIDLEPQEGAK